MSVILLVEDKESLALMLQDALRSDGFEVEHARTAERAIEFLSRRRYAAVITDLRLPGKDGIEVVRQARAIDPDCPVVVMTAFGTVENAVEAMKIGAIDFLQKPVDVDHLILVARRSREIRALRDENLILREEFRERFAIPPIIGQSAALGDVSRQIQKVAPTDSTVLILGESGTGKELFARAIHQLSPRRNRPFVAINCAAIPDTLIENELFGHERGAYTGAVGRQPGKFELAEKGTVFLDEIAELGRGVQAKILRVLQEREFERIGGSAPIRADVRIVCATNRDLEQEVRDGRFRDDLFFRINVFPVEIPPLRTRRDDILPLATHFAAKFGREMGKGEITIAEDARALLLGHPWPGNIRELENAIERAVILAERNVIRADDFALRSDPSVEGDLVRRLFDLGAPLEQIRSRAVALVERSALADALRRHASRSEAAHSLGLTPRVLAGKLREYGLDDNGGDRS
jgi:DNA-binding NtrC family response regulator